MLFHTREQDFKKLVSHMMAVKDLTDQVADYKAKNVE